MGDLESANVNVQFYYYAYALNPRSTFSSALTDAVITDQAFLLPLEASGAAAGFWSFFPEEKGQSITFCFRLTDAGIYLPSLPTNFGSFRIFGTAATVILCFMLFFKVFMVSSYLLGLLLFCFKGVLRIEGKEKKNHS